MAAQKRFLKIRLASVSRMNRAAKWRDAVEKELEANEKAGIKHYGVNNNGDYVEMLNGKVKVIKGRKVAGTYFSAETKPKTSSKTPSRGKQVSREAG
jgi:hypothetical protein